MLNRPTTVLVMDDDVSTAVPLTIGLQDQGYRALHAMNGPQGVELARVAQPDLILLDVMLPPMDGYAVCRTLRRESAPLIIMLAACGLGIDRGRIREAGADDCMVEPFGFRQLLARMRVLLYRRELSREPAAPPTDRIVVGDIALDRSAHQVWRNDELIEMPQREFDLLCVLMENAGKALRRRELLDQVWGEGWIGYPRTLNVHIYRLRHKLERDPSAPRYIQTVHGYGYRFEDPAANEAGATQHVPALSLREARPGLRPSEARWGVAVNGSASHLPGLS